MPCRAGSNDGFRPKADIQVLPTHQLYAGSKRGDALDDPESRYAADGIWRNAPSPHGWRHADAPVGLPCERNDGEDRCDEQDLADLDADVEEEQRDGNRRLRQADFA